MKVFVSVIVLSLCVLSSCASFQESAVQRNLAAEYFFIAEGYAEIAKYEKAIPYYQKASLVTEYANASYYGLGRMYALTGKWKEACGVLKLLYEQDKDNLLISSAYAFALASNAQKKEALVIYEEVWKRNTEDPVAGKNYAEMLYLSELYSESLDQIILLKEKYPDSGDLKGLDVLEKKVNEALSPSTEPESPESSVQPDVKENEGAPSASLPPVNTI